MTFLKVTNADEVNPEWGIELLNINEIICMVRMSNGRTAIIMKDGRRKEVSESISQIEESLKKLS